MLRDHGYGASALHGVPVYTPALTDTKLYFLVTEALDCYSTAWWLGLKPATIESLAHALALDYRANL